MRQVSVATTTLSCFSWGRFIRAVLPNVLWDYEIVSVSNEYLSQNDSKSV